MLQSANLFYMILEGVLVHRKYVNYKAEESLDGALVCKERLVIKEMELRGSAIFTWPSSCRFFATFVHFNLIYDELSYFTADFQ